jgi:hypothetical protein
MKTRLLVAGVLIATLFSVNSGYGAEKKSGSKGAPDFTKDLSLVTDPDVQEWRHWMMGPTGARIWVWADHKTIWSDGAKQIYVVKVDSKTPASGKLEAGDIILGATGGVKAVPFVKNARSEVAQAITDAEKEENKGVLNLLVSRKGVSTPVTLTLPVMGSFSTTSPVNCEKTKKIVDQIAARIVEKGELKETGISEYLKALGLLATGEEKYLPFVKAFAHKVGPPDLKFGPEANAWISSYKLIFLAEYYAATKDEAVLPALTEMSTKIALSRSGVGTWGHKITVPSGTQRRYAPASGYGCMNAVGVPLTIGLVLAQKCGIKSQEIDTTVRMSADFLRYFIDKGSLPYGDHEPYLGAFDNNGTSSMAAVLFDLLGDKETAAFFTAMTMASVREREDGHNGPYFSIVWGGLGAACGGDEATSAFMKDLRWYYELMRRPGGDERYQPVLRGGQEKGAYGRSPTWNTAGAALMHYCAPRKKIFLTGKGGRASSPMTPAQIQECLRVCVKDFYKNCTTDELLKLLEHPLPITRNRAATELGERDENVVPQLITLLSSPSRVARYGACEGLRYASRNSAEAAEALMAKALTSDDYTLRYYAVLAFGKPSGSQGFDSVAKKAGPALLKLAATEDLKNDPFRKLQGTVASILFYSGNAKKFSGIYPNGKGTEKLDRALFEPAARSLFTNPNGAARSGGSDICKLMTEEELEGLWGEIYKTARVQAPSGDQFGGGAHRENLELLVKYHFKEGMDLILHNIQHPRHGTRAFNPILVDLLENYGTHAKPLVPVIRETIKKNITEKEVGKKYFQDLEKSYQAIEKSTRTPKLRTLASSPKIPDTAEEE